MIRDVYDRTDKQPWVEPKIDVLAVEDTEALNGRGADGGPYNPTSQRS